MQGMRGNPFQKLGVLALPETVANLVDAELPVLKSAPELPVYFYSVKNLWLHLYIYISKAPFLPY